MSENKSLNAIENNAPVYFNVGIDLVEIKRFEKYLDHEKFMTRVFSDKEREIFSKKANKVQSFAANFSVKEAFAKAIGTGIRGFKLNEVSVLRDELGAPYFVFEGKAKEIVAENNFSFSISLTHTKDYASATVLAYRMDK